MKHSKISPAPFPFPIKGGLLILISLFILCTSTACSSGNKHSDTFYKDTKYSSGKWIDADTFRIYVTGYPSQKTADIEQRKASAKKAAYLDAHYTLLGKFKVEREEAIGVMQKYTREEDRLRKKELVDIIRGG